MILVGIIYHESYESYIYIYIACAFQLPGGIFQLDWHVWFLFQKTSQVSAAASMLFPSGCKSTNLWSTALVALETSVFLTRSMNELLHFITQETHFFRIHCGQMLAFRCTWTWSQELQRHSYQVRQDMCMLQQCQGSQGVQLDDSQHGMVGLGVGEQYTLRFQMHHGANDADH